MKTLPDTLSGLLKVAIKDLKKAEASKDYVVDMGEWHTPRVRGTRCEVCLAGAVMAFSLDAPIEKLLMPVNFEESLRSKINALNCLRMGEVGAAGHCLFKDGGKLRGRLNREVRYYDDDRDGFHADMEQLQFDLEEAGL